MVSNLGTFTVNAQGGHFQGTLGQPLFVTYGNETRIQALSADRGSNGVLKASGAVEFRELDTVLKSTFIEINPITGDAEADGASFYQYPYDIKAEHLSIGREPMRAAGIRHKGQIAEHGKSNRSIDIQADGVSLSTAPPNTKPDFELRGRSLVLDRATHHLILRDGSIYLFQRRIVRVPYFSVPVGKGGGGASSGFIRPAAGFSQREGSYVALDARNNAEGTGRYGFVLPLRHSVQAYAAALQNFYLEARPQPSQPVVLTGFQGAMANLRQVAEITRGALPFGDPLTYHDFIPQYDPIDIYEQIPRKRVYTSEEVGYHVASSGHRHDDLQVTRLPELSVGAYLPLSDAQLPSGGQDGRSFRSALRDPRFVVTAVASAGEIREDPGNVHDSRERVQTELTTEPLLIARNLVIVPSITAASSFYSGSRKNYSLLQGSIALRQYFNDRTAIEVQYLRSKTSGESPFNFDTLDTTREIDYRVQVGTHRLSIGGALRYDLSQHSYIDYKISAATELNGLEPVIQYSFRTRRLGVGFEVPGITF